MSKALRAEARAVVEDLKGRFGILAGPILCEAILEACEIKRGYVEVSERVDEKTARTDMALSRWRTSDYLARRKQILGGAG